MMGVFVQLNDGNPNGMSQRYPVGYVIQENGCWDWVGTTNPKGYGQITATTAGRMRLAHRTMYERVKGPIPEGMTLDHLCRNRLCVNPDHLEPVTSKENVLRGVGHTASNARKTHCHRGHEFNKENTRIWTGKTRGSRRCRACARDWKAQRRAK